MYKNPNKNLWRKKKAISETKESVSKQHSSFKKKYQQCLQPTSPILWQVRKIALKISAFRKDWACSAKTALQWNELQTTY